MRWKVNDEMRGLSFLELISNGMIKGFVFGLYYFCLFLLLKFSVVVVCFRNIFIYYFMLSVDLFINW